MRHPFGTVLGYQCPFDDGNTFLNDLQRLHAWLPRVVTRLRDAQSDLIPTCVSPSRSKREVAAENWQRSIALKKLPEFQTAPHVEEHDPQPVPLASTGDLDERVAISSSSNPAVAAAADAVVPSVEVRQPAETPSWVTQLAPVLPSQVVAPPPLVDGAIASTVLLLPLTMGLLLVVMLALLCGCSAEKRWKGAKRRNTADPSDDGSETQRLQADAYLAPTEENIGKQEAECAAMAALAESLKLGGS